MVTTSLPPGFRFHPTDVELVMYYLKRKVLGKKLHFEAIAEVNIYKFSPWDLPDMSCLKSKDLEWFFFCPREKKYASGSRVKRATENGYWKTTGKDRPISYKEKTAGTVRTLIFHLGHAPQGQRTDWVIHEYRILDDQLAAAGVQDAYVLCKVFKKNGPGPKNGAQYGAPFNEADWTDDDVDAAQNQDIPLACDGPSPPLRTLPENQGSPLVTGLVDPGKNMSELPLSEEGPSPSAGRSTSEVLIHETDDEMVCLLAQFVAEDSLLFNENGVNQDDLNGKGKHTIPYSDGYDIYNGLGDLGSWAQLNGGQLDFSGVPKDDYLQNMFLQDYLSYDDLLVPLDCSGEIVGTDQSPVGEVCGSCIRENMLQFYAGGSLSSMDQHASCSNQLSVPASCSNQLSMLPDGPYEGDECLGALNIVNNNQFYQGSPAVYDLDFSDGQPENGINFSQDMERAAEHVARSFCSCGGSSIHIKAEVTHGGGECTNEALSVMMEGSSSCWRLCKLSRAVSLSIHLMLCLVDLGFLVLLLVSCYFCETVCVSWSCYYSYLNEYVLRLPCRPILLTMQVLIRICQMRNFVKKKV